MAPERVLVVGGTGRTGTRLVDKLRDEHRSASVDDALRMSLPINNLPAIDIDEEIARAKENWFKL